MWNREKEAALSPQLIQELVEYNPLTGELIWKRRSPKHFSQENIRHTPEHVCEFWNSRFSGRSVGGTLNPKGYRMIRVMRKAFLAHRVAWAVYYSTWPDGEVDHIDHDTSNNTIVNLRAVDRQNNLRNASMRTDNSSGVTGVRRLKDNSAWVAFITLSPGCRRQRRFPPTTSGFADACAWRQSMQLKHGFHQNHGK